MTARKFLTNVTIILGVMAVGALIETVVPMFAAKTWTRDRRGANLGLTGLAFLFSWLLASVVATLALELRPAGVLARLGWPMWTDLVVGIVMLDFSLGHLSHRTMHAWPAMVVIAQSTRMIRFCGPAATGECVLKYSTSASMSRTPTTFSVPSRSTG
jgi:hypothetical protein